MATVLASTLSATAVVETEPEAEPPAPEVGVFAHRHGKALSEAIERLRAGTQGDWRSHVARQTLEELGPDALEVFFAALGGATVDAEGSHLRPEERELLVDVMRHWPKRKCLPAIVARVGDESPLEEKLLVTELFGRLGEGSDLLELARYLQTIEVGPATSSRVAGKIQESFERLLRADRGAFEVADEVLGGNGLPPYFDVPLARALGAVGSGDTHAYFERLFETEAPNLDVLDALGQVTGDVGDAARERSVRLAERFLSSTRPRLRREALLTLAELGDPSSVQHLLDALQDNDRQVSRGALLGLRSFSGKNFGEELDPWLRWHEAEQAWYRDEFVPECARAATMNGGEALAFLREASRHRLFRMAITEELARVLPGAPAHFQAAACHALSQLGDPWAVEPLQQLLQSGDDRVASAATTALRHMGHSVNRALAR